MKILDGFKLRTIMGKPIVVAEGPQLVRFRKMISLNESAHILWQELQGREFSVDDMAGILMREYEVDRETAVKDAGEIAAKWIRLGFVGE